MIPPILHVRPALPSLARKKEPLPIACKRVLRSIHSWTLIEFSIGELKLLDKVPLSGGPKQVWQITAACRESSLVDERGLEPPASSLRKQTLKLDGAELDEKEEEE
jgi:hypothetical protein